MIDFRRHVKNVVDSNAIHRRLAAELVPNRTSGNLQRLSYPPPQQNRNSTHQPQKSPVAIYDRQNMDSAHSYAQSQLDLSTQLSWGGYTGYARNYSLHPDINHEQDHEDQLVDYYEETGPYRREGNQHKHGYEPGTERVFEFESTQQDASERELEYHHGPDYPRDISYERDPIYERELSHEYGRGYEYGAHGEDVPHLEHHRHGDEHPFTSQISSADVHPRWSRTSDVAHGQGSDHRDYKRITDVQGRDPEGYEYDQHNRAIPSNGFATTCDYSERPMGGNSSSSLPDTAWLSRSQLSTRDRGSDIRSAYERKLNGDRPTHHKATHERRANDWRLQAPPTPASSVYSETSMPPAQHSILSPLPSLPQNVDHLTRHDLPAPWPVAKQHHEQSAQAAPQKQQFPRHLVHISSPAQYQRAYFSNGLPRVPVSPVAGYGPPSQQSIPHVPTRPGSPSYPSATRPNQGGSSLSANLSSGPAAPGLMHGWPPFPPTSTSSTHDRLRQPSTGLESFTAPRGDVPMSDVPSALWLLDRLRNASLPYNTKEAHHITTPPPPLPSQEPNHSPRPLRNGSSALEPYDPMHSIRNIVESLHSSGANDHDQGVAPPPKRPRFDDDYINGMTDDRRSA
jgi:hypothetical protein